MNLRKLIGKWREKAKKMRFTPWLAPQGEAEAVTLVTCADELESALTELSDGGDSLTAAYMMGVERRKEITRETLEAARLWKLQVEADKENEGWIARDSWGKWHIRGSSEVFDTRAEALDAWDKSRKEAEE
jgi:hypothetical protein